MLARVRTRPGIWSESRIKSAFMCAAAGALTAVGVRFWVARLILTDGAAHGPPRGSKCPVFLRRQARRCKLAPVPVPLRTCFWREQAHRVVVINFGEHVSRQCDPADLPVALDWRGMIKFAIGCLEVPA